MEKTKTRIMLRLIIGWAIVIAIIIFFAITLNACGVQAEEVATASDESGSESVVEESEPETVKVTEVTEEEEESQKTDGWGFGVTYVNEEPTQSDYIPYQEKYSRDWNEFDEEAMMKLAQYKGGSIEDKAYNILVTLNRSKEWNKTIIDIVFDELFNTEGVQEGDYPDIIPNDDCKVAMYNIVRERFDNSKGSTEYRSQKKEKVESEQTESEPEEAEENHTYLGNYKITAYAETGNPCANGNYPQTEYTIACNSLPFGSKVYIEDVGYRIVEDRGASWHEDEWIDLYLGDSSSCYQWGVKYKDVYLVEE